MAHKFDFQQTREDLDQAIDHLRLLISSIGAAESAGKYADDIWKNALGHSRIVGVRVLDVEKRLVLRTRQNERERCHHYATTIDGKGWKRCQDCGKRERVKGTASPLIETM